MSNQLLLDMQRFSNGKNAYHRDEPTEVTQQNITCGLKLLEMLPVIRDTVFDYFSMIFDVAISNHIKMEKTQIQQGQQQHQLIHGNEKLINMIKDGLEKVISEQTWAASFISQWSLSRLIKPSVEYAKILNLDFKAACSLWLGCNGTRILLDLCGACFNKFDDIAMKRFIYDLENVFADNRPNFDWCVAHLSALFPLKFISNILRMPQMFTPAFITSSITVLEYLSNTSEKSLNQLLREIIDEALDGDKNDLQSKDYIPNLLQLSSKSEIYAQAILNVFLDYMERDTCQFVEKLKCQIISRPLDFNPERLQIILPELILKTKENGTKLLIMLIDVFESNYWCVELVELIITELEMIIFNDKMCPCPLFNDIRRESTWPVLWKACTSDKKLLQQTAIRLILIASSERHPVLYNKTIEELITKNTIAQPNIFNALVRLFDDPIGISDVVDVSVGVAISHIVQRLFVDVKLRTHQNQSFFVIRNLTELIILEKESQNPFLKRGAITLALHSSIRTLINIWDYLLRKVMMDVENVQIDVNKETHDDLISKRIKLEPVENEPMEIADLEEEKNYDVKDQIHMLTKLMDSLITSNVNINMSDALRCEKLTVKYFFWSLTETEKSLSLVAIDRSYNLLSKQCTEKKGIRSAALRDLLEGALFLYGNLFGSPSKNSDNDKTASSRIYHTKDESLLKLNQKQGISLNISRSSILHSGVIGAGIPKISKPWIPDSLDNMIKDIYIKAIIACCYEENEEGDNKIIEGLCLVSQFLVELVTTDVMYNGLAWPAEEEFSKITIERDLHIRRTFKNCPILWSILGLLAVYKKPLWCNCSVFLRALCASVMHHWRAKSTETISGNNSELMFFTEKLLELMTLAQLLPTPLNYLHIVVKHLEPSEIAYVLKECVWNYMVANGSTFFTEDFIRTPSATEPTADQFIDPLRNTMQKKISILGSLYYQMFVLPHEIKNNSNV
ncbi:hypothetical protein PVAND_001145 [Polypedilum vanderplanki]|uniref:Integrator complex subunit 5 n=1 Tax=Polypedilum vanderplanki TaxID=319348 RepID=A0A9J6BM23_POLVA|nr:hypothetical protein PVAND_001145 [Polypedilum vanderplanki]